MIRLKKKSAEVGMKSSKNMKAVKPGTKASKASKTRESPQLEMNPPKKRKSPEVDESQAKRRKPAELDDKQLNQKDSVELEKIDQADQSSGDEVEAVSSFKDLGVVDPLCEACERLGFKTPTPIQEQAIPVALEGRDVIGIAVTGSGKTAAFILPILQSLLEKPQPFYAVVLSPTRELAEQTKKVFLALGSLISLRCALITGGHDMAQQKIAIGQKPHVIVATPGRLADHLEKTKGFSLRNLKCLVLDEADRLLDLDFGPSIDKILNFIPRERNTYLFSATMSSKVEKLRRASLRDPVKVAVSENSYEKVKTLIQHFAFLPAKFKKVYLLHVLTQFVGRSTIVFVRLRQDALFIAAFLKCLGFNAVGTHGQLPQNVREAALNRFRERAKDILVTTDVIARGIDITGVDLIINFDPPMDTMTYMHRVGRTARAGRSGRAITFVSENHIEQWLAIEKALGGRVPEYERWEVVQDEVLELRPRAEEAEYFARRERSDDRKERDKRKKVARAARGRRYEDDMDLEER